MVVVSPTTIAGMRKDVKDITRERRSQTKTMSKSRQYMRDLQKSEHRQGVADTLGGEESIKSAAYAQPMDQDESTASSASSRGGISYT